MGRYGGGLAQIRTDDLAALPMRALMERNPDSDPALIDDVVFGCANQAGEDNRNVARMAAAAGRAAARCPGTTINRLCGSGMDAVGIAARAIKAGEADLMIAGGVESMSRAPFVMAKADRAFSRDAEIYDTTIGWRFVNPLMAGAVRCRLDARDRRERRRGIRDPREDQDAFAAAQPAAAAAAGEAGASPDEIVPVTCPRRKGDPLVVDRDEHPRPDTTARGAGPAATRFRKTARSPPATPRASTTARAPSWSPPRPRRSSTVSAPGPRRGDGARPGCRRGSWASARCRRPRRLLDRAGWSLDEMDVIELNEAFAARRSRCTRDLGLADDDPHVNPNGGAIALGHPLGMSGARLVTTAPLPVAANRGRYRPVHHVHRCRAGHRHDHRARRRRPGGGGSVK